MVGDADDGWMFTKIYVLLAAIDVNVIFFYGRLCGRFFVLCFM